MEMERAGAARSRATWSVRGGVPRAYRVARIGRARAAVVPGLPTITTMRCLGFTADQRLPLGLQSPWPTVLAPSESCLHCRAQVRPFKASCAAARGRRKPRGRIGVLDAGCRQQTASHQVSLGTHFLRYRSRAGRKCGVDHTNRKRRIDGNIQAESGTSDSQVRKPGHGLRSHPWPR